MHDDATRNRFATRSLLPGLLALVLLALPVRAGDAEHVTLEKAEEEVEFLHDVLRSPRAVNDQILGALDAVASVLEHLPPPPALVTVPIPEDASEDRREELEDQNDRAERDWKKALRKHERAVERLRDDAEDLVLDALKETKLSSGSNVREPVNVRAARLIGTWDDPKVARKVQRILERYVLDAKYPVSDRMLEEGFAALAHIGSPTSLEWLVDEFSHTRSTPEHYVDQLLAAHKAMLLFPLAQVAGDLRYDIVEQMLRSYAGVESQAEQSSTDPALVRARVFWGRIGRGVVSVLQRYAGEPTNDRGVQLATVAEFQNWFRDHKSPRDEVWQDPEQS